MTAVTITGGTFTEAREKATDRATKTADGKAITPGPIVKVRTRTVRIILAPEKVTTKSGQRDFGKERIKSRIDGHVIKRTFVFA